jgi:Skp family chaperone for outer membrane proteins
MKIVLSVLLAIAVIGCILFGVAFSSTQSDLNQTKTQLTAAQAELTDTQTQLSGVNTKLAQTQKDLTNTEAKLTDTQADLHTANEDLSAAKTDLAKTKFSLTDVTHQLDTAKAYNTQMSNSYAGLRETIYQKLGKGTDSEKYFTPKDPVVVAKAREIAGAFSTEGTEMWRDYQQMYQWVVNNIEYYADTNLPLLPATPDGELKWLAEYWKTPAETLADGSGDCEDMANLLASLLLSYNNGDFAVWAVIIHDNEGNGHAAVALPVKGDRLVIYDPAGNYYSGHTLGYVQSDSISGAVSTWLAHWSDQLPGVKITAVYSNDFYKEFTGTNDFIDWAVNRY